MTERPLERPNLDQQGWAENATKSLAPMMTGAARANLELASLASRRARAYLDLPMTLALCRAPQALFAAQTQFWQTAIEEYSACGRRFVAALSAHIAVAPAGDDAGSQRRERDTLTFQDVFGLTPWALPESAQLRRAAEDRAA